MQCAFRHVISNRRFGMNPLVNATEGDVDSRGDEPTNSSRNDQDSDFTQVPLFKETSRCWRRVNPPTYPDLIDEPGSVIVPLSEETKDGIFEWMPAGNRLVDYLSCMKVICKSSCIVVVRRKPGDNMFVNTTQVPSIYIDFFHTYTYFWYSQYVAVGLQSTCC
jgi:hypothetical protein